MTNRSGGPASPDSGRRRGNGSRRTWRSGLATAATLGLTATLLSSCGATPASPDQLVHQPRPACRSSRSTPRSAATSYDIEITRSPAASATDQRIQLARRLAAEDSATDLMNLDPVFVAEFANAGWLAEIPSEKAGPDHRRAATTSRAPVETVTWEDGVCRDPALGQHPGALVPQVARRQGRHRHVAAGHLGAGHQRRGREQRQRGRPGQQVRGLRRVDQRADLRARAARSSPTPRTAATRRRGSTPRPGQQAAEDRQGARRLRRSPERPVGRPTRAPASAGCSRPRRTIPRAPASSW